MLKKIKQIIGTAVLAGALYLSSGCAATQKDVLIPEPLSKPAITAVEKPESREKKPEEEKKETGEIKIFQLYNLKDDYGMTKTELNGKLPGKIDAWGFIETDGKGYFALATATKEIYKPLFAALAHRSCDGFKDHAHAGIKIKGKPFGEDGPFISGKLMQKLDSDSDTKIGIYVSQDFNDFLSFEAMYDRDVRGETFYAEGSLIFKPFKDTDFEGLEFLIQGRSAGSIHHKKHKDKRFPIDTFIGFSYKF